MRRGGIEPPAPRRCWMATENFTTKPSALFDGYSCSEMLELMQVGAYVALWMGEGSGP
ncbi:hypothetical protein CMUS01_01659 [Colletotrichum musicola]|uniref:Uncharacterized protein n=1 Tax=Colletotrichum musicola TaxID=2175873 RepID=A0A8H6NWI4_9PEZI|nr:hypothetical protein CMUS01_01659 [Colletotrichum musicola]